MTVFRPILTLWYFSSLLFLSDSADNLQTSFCRNNTDYNFCQYVFNQDPHPRMDKPLLTVIAIKQTYWNASRTKDFIAANLNGNGRGSGGGGGDPGLRKCFGFYNQSISITSNMLSLADTDELPLLKDLAPDLQRSVKGCIDAFPGKATILTKRNFDMLRLSNIVTQACRLF